MRTRFGVLVLAALVAVMCSATAAADAAEGTHVFPLLVGACPMDDRTEAWRNDGQSYLRVTGGVVEDEGHPGDGFLSVVLRRASDGALIAARSGSVDDDPEQVASACGTSVPVAPGDSVLFTVGCFCPPGRTCSDKVDAWGYVSWVDEPARPARPPLPPWPGARR